MEQAGRGVLKTGTRVVDAVAGAQHGIGIAELARHTGLPKSTAHRLAGQLIDAGMLERVGDRYYVGATVGQWGKRRRPARVLHRAADLPVKRLGLLTRALVGVVVLNEGTPETVVSFAPDALPLTLDPATKTWRQSAVGQALTSSDDERVFGEERDGISCVATGLWLPGLGFRAVLGAWYFRPTLPATGLVQLHEAKRAIERSWNGVEVGVA